MSNDLPPPTPTPPSIEVAVREHLDVVHAVGELRHTTDKLVEQQAATAKAVTSLGFDLGRLSDVLTTASLTVERLERRVTSLEGKVDTLLMGQRAIARHLGVPIG